MVVRTKKQYCALGDGIRATINATPSVFEPGNSKCRAFLLHSFTPVAQTVEQPQQLRPAARWAAAVEDRISCDQFKRGRSRSKPWRGYLDGWITLRTVARKGSGVRGIPASGRRHWVIVARQTDDRGADIYATRTPIRKGAATYAAEPRSPLQFPYFDAQAEKWYDGITSPSNSVVARASAKTRIPRSSSSIAIIA